MRTRQGVIPYVHLIKATTDINGVLTMCNRWGTTMPRFDDDRGIRCPECDIAQQLT